MYVMFPWYKFSFNLVALYVFDIFVFDFTHEEGL